MSVCRFNYRLLIDVVTQEREHSNANDGDNEAHEK
jgi:hypothetical protein